MLQRSTVSFRREGSSGLVWDDSILADEIKQLVQKEGKTSTDIRELRACQSTGGIGNMKREGYVSAPPKYTRS
uniref:Uncharacterized protein n=1 Tax=Kalanchoe fedtschenkoi TaxID=63787 RepID=A0A7N0VKG3_KALFE